MSVDSGLASLDVCSVNLIRFLNSDKVFEQITYSGAAVLTAAGRQICHHYSCLSIKETHAVSVRKPVAVYYNMATNCQP